MFQILRVFLISTFLSNDPWLETFKIFESLQQYFHILSHIYSKLEILKN